MAQNGTEALAIRLSNLAIRLGNKCGCLSRDASVDALVHNIMTCFKLSPQCLRSKAPEREVFSLPFSVVARVA